jgi:hypothetical protein
MGHTKYVAQYTKPLSVQFIVTWQFYCHRRSSECGWHDITLWGHNSLTNKFVVRNCDRCFASVFFPNAASLTHSLQSNSVSSNRIKWFTKSFFNSFVTSAFRPNRFSSCLIILFSSTRFFFVAFRIFYVKVNPVSAISSFRHTARVLDIIFLPWCRI